MMEQIGDVMERVARRAMGDTTARKESDMLVLGRRKGEAIKIGGDIEVMVVDIDGAIVKVGITAPPDVNIVRDELDSGPHGGRQASEE
jgi:carbon storage regulator